MEKYTHEFKLECIEDLMKAEEIKANKELMSELKPLMKEQGKKMMDMPESLDELWKRAKLNANKKNLPEDDDMVEGKRVGADEEPKLGSKA